MLLIASSPQEKASWMLSLKQTVNNLQQVQIKVPQRRASTMNLILSNMQGINFKTSESPRGERKNTGQEILPISVSKDDSPPLYSHLSQINPPPTLSTPPSTLNTPPPTLNTPPPISLQQMQQSGSDSSLGDWREAITADGRKYYWNPITKQTSWVPVMNNQNQQNDEWKEAVTPDGRKYFFL